MQTPIGFIGQGWIGKHYADDFENRGHKVVRYALEEPFVHNKMDIKDCAIVFIAVPTPTTPSGFSYEAVRSALTLLAPASTAVIKSTILPGVTKKLQEEFKDLFVLHSPEFLREATASHDAANPDRNIIGIPKADKDFEKRAHDVLAVLPNAPYQVVLPAIEAELVKYIGNCFLYSKVLMMNAFYDTTVAVGGQWESVRRAVAADPRIGESHTKPLHDSGRGAGGHCFIKDFEAFRKMYQEEVGEEAGNHLLQSLVAYNNQLLISSKKDLDLLTGVYGPSMLPEDT